jgi:hypothetical protein
MAVAATAPLAALAPGVLEVVSALGGAVESLRALGPWVAAPVAVAGLVALTVGTRRARPLAACGGAALGALFALALRAPLQTYLAVSPAAAAAAGAVAVGTACGAFPATFPFALGALPGALLGGGVALGGQPALGAAAGALAGGFVAALAARVVTALFAALAGAIAFGVGAAALAGVHPLARELAARPFALAGLAVVLAVAGAAFQLERGAAGARDPPIRQPDRVPPGSERSR